MLFGLSAVAVPILIHLLNRKRVRRIVWAAMRFLQVSVEQNQRRMKIEDVVLLALRCALLALLALALARPMLGGGGQGVGSKVVAIIVLDNSYSMAMSDGTATRFDKARNAAEQIVSSMPPGSAVAVWCAANDVQAIIPEPTVDLGLARKAIQQTQLSGSASDLLPAISRALDALRGRIGSQREFYLITDGQALGWSRFQEIQAQFQRAKSDVRAQLVLINEHETHNLGVSELRLDRGLSPIQQPLRFQVRVTNFGRDVARDVPVSLSVDFEAPSDQFTIAQLTPGASQSLSLFAKLTNAGFHTIIANIPNDRLRTDDSRAWAVRAVNNIRVLLVDGDGGDELNGSVGATFFLRNALAPVNAETRDSYFIRTTVATDSELANVRLDDFDAVILAGVPRLSEQLAGQVHRFVQRGGGLMIFPGPRAEPEFYSNLSFLPAKVGGVQGDATQDEKYVTIANNFEHPIASLWKDPAAGTLSSARFFRRYALVPREISTVVLKYEDESPAVIECAASLGRIILFSSSANTAWNDWPLRPSFVPFIHRCMAALLRQREEGLNIRAGEAYSRRLDAAFLSKEAIVRKPGQDEGGEVRRVSLESGIPVLSYDNTTRAGIYSVSFAEPPLTEKFAVQSDPAESSLDQLSAAQLQGYVANVVEWTPAFTRQIENGRGGAEFWLPLVVLGIAMGGLEMWLSQWFSRSK